MSRVSPAGLNQLRIRHLKLIEALVGVGSVHKAARTLHLSQPSASALLKEVEEALGVTLFDRSGKGVLPNPHGSVVIGRVRTILGELAMLTEELSGSPLQVLRLGSLTHAFYGGLQRVLPEFLARSECRVDLREGTLKNLIQLLQDNQLDCLIGRLPSASTGDLMQRGFVYRPLYQLEMCVLAPASHPLAKKRHVTLPDLARFSWILSREGANSRYTILAAFAAAGLPQPAIRIETSSFLYSLQLLPASDWLTIVPREAGLGHERLGLARILPVKLPNLLSPVAFIASRSAMMNPNVKLFAEIVEKSISPAGKNPRFAVSCEE
jgi:DNA-binding transcriptional LysR family regulator